MKTKILTIIMLCGVWGGYAQTTPRYAASALTWVFGSQTWSDAIQVPECNKTSFTNSSTNSDCRSYTFEGKTYYYYNWPYVIQHATTLCPAPWRVPTNSDQNALVSVTTTPALATAWGLAGHTFSMDMYAVGSRGYIWSSTAISTTTSYNLAYGSGSQLISRPDKYLGFQVRCVRDK
jgi:hypothetical protein